MDRPQLTKIQNNNRGQGIVDYTLIVLLVALGFWLALHDSNLAGALQTAWTDIGGSISAISDGSTGGAGGASGGSSGGSGAGSGGNSGANSGGTSGDSSGGSSGGGSGSGSGGGSGG